MGVVLVVFAGMTVVTGHGQQGQWAAADNTTAKFMVDAERQWAEAACTHNKITDKILADDFQGTATDGHRYDKAEAIATDPKVVARDCQLGEVKVRFFGDSIAIAYGAENRIRKAEGGNEARRCQVWTDTWLKRNGQWQIVAAQDTVIPCPQ